MSAILKASLVCVICIFATISNTHARNYKILFVGNSYVSTNDLPGTLRTMAASMGDTFTMTSVAPGGFTLANHWNSASSIAALSQPGWDFIIFQAQSQEPSFPPSQVQTQTFPYAKSLDSLAKVFSPCAEVMYYMTWGRKYGDAANCVGYPVLCTYDGMQGRLRDSYVQMASDNKSSVCPVGQVWRSVRQQDSTIELYVSDQSHPTVTGTYLAASAFYTSITHRALSNSSYVPVGVDTAHASLIRSTAINIVMDSIETWQGSGSMPLAKFNASASALTATLTNASKRNSICNIYWGDATSTLGNCAANLQHNYPSNGSYNIILVVKDSCGSTDSAQQSVSIAGNVAIAQHYLAAAQVYTHHGSILINNAQGCMLQLYTVQGQLLQQVDIANHATRIAIGNSQEIIVYRLSKLGYKTATGILR
jgi:hypothetical protein